MTSKTVDELEVGKVYQIINSDLNLGLFEEYLLVYSDRERKHDFSCLPIDTPLLFLGYEFPIMINVDTSETKIDKKIPYVFFDDQRMMLHHWTESNVRFKEIGNQL